MGTPLLLADGDPVARDVVAQVLTGLSYDVLSARDGREALELYARHHPRLVVLDAKLEHEDGLTVCRRIRQQGGHQAYVFLLSSSVRTQDAMLGLEAGANDIVAKPFPLRELTARLWMADRMLNATPNDPRTVLEAALESGRGEVVVTAPTGSGRVLIHEGHVGWVAIHGWKESLHDLLDGVCEATPNDLDLVLKESRRTRRHYADVLIDWRLVDEGALHERLRTVIARKLTHLLALPAAEAVFARGTNLPLGSMRYRLDELIAPRARISLPPWSPLAPETIAPPATERSDELRAIARQLASVPGVEGVAITDEDNAFPRHAVGEPLERSRLRDHCRLLTGADATGLDDGLVLTTPHHWIIATAFRRHGRFIAHLRARRDETTTLAMVRYRMRQVLEDSQAGASRSAPDL